MAWPEDDGVGLLPFLSMEAEAWVERTALSSDSIALFQSDCCESHIYSQDTIPAAEFVERHRISPTEVGLLTEEASVALVFLAVATGALVVWNAWQIFRLRDSAVATSGHKSGTSGVSSSSV